MTPEPPKHEPADLLEFLYRLAQAYLACGEQTAQVELLLRRIASSYGARRARVVCFPTAIFISFHIDEKEHVTIAEGPLQALRLDQMADVYALGAEAQRGVIALRDGMQELTAILRKPARFGTLGTVFGHTILTVGVAIVLNPALLTVGVAAILGVVVGALKLLMRDRPVFSVPLPVVGAVVVSSIVFQSVKMGLPVDPLHVLVPPLVTFLPGAMLTFGMIELAYGDMVSGASRLITGFVQLVLLVFGILAGAALVGMRHDTMPEAAVQLASIPWLPWVGAVIFGVGVSLHFSAPKRSLPWMLLVVLLAFSAQRLSAPLVGNQFSGFFGTLVATPLGYLIQLRFRGPPPMVTFLPSFWLLVPGALSLLSVKQMISDTTSGVDGLISATFVFASIALGTLFGASVYKWLTERKGMWQLQIGRVGRRPDAPGKKK